MSRNLAPKTHILRSKRARSWSLSGALGELVDNSLGHANAKHIEIKLDDDLISVTDDGSGMDDIFRLFTFGDSTGHADVTNIGQYGVGATDATVWLGDRVTVATVRDAMRHQTTVDWAAVEHSGNWNVPNGKQAATNDPSGTLIRIKGLHRLNKGRAVDTLMTDLGRIFAPALHAGIQIKVTQGSAEPTFVQPYTPQNITDQVLINGEIMTSGGPLSWYGRAGLSENLATKHNGVHISFGHRVIEVTREPFGSDSAPTLYVEVMLDKVAAGKNLLNDHKDEIQKGKNRDALMASIREQILPLLQQSAEQAFSLALNCLAAPLEKSLVKALRGAGILHIDETEEPQPGGRIGVNEEPVEKPGSNRLFDPKDEGTEAKEKTQKPTGISIAFVDSGNLGEKLYDWSIGGKLLHLMLDRELYKNTVGWPPRQRDENALQIVVANLSAAIAAECMNHNSSMIALLNPKLRVQVEAWRESTTEAHKIAPMLNRTLLANAC